MKQALRVLLIVALVSSLPAFADDKDDHSSSSKQNDSEAVQRLNESAADLNRLTNAPDNNIPQSILADAKCVAIVPKLIKGGFIVGAEHGRGVATCRTEKGSWSAPAFFAITGGSWGAQIGVEGVDLVLLFMNKEGADKLLSAEWKVGADAGIAAGPYGRQAGASADWKMNSGILTYSRAKGVFVGATLNGANVRADMDAIKAFYGRPVNFRDILTGKVAPPPAAHKFLADIRQNFHEANASK
jgi:lipid-binding SYLF domain-containing protein